MPNQEKETLRDLRLKRSLQETDGNTLGSPEKDQKAQDLAKEAKELIQQAILGTKERTHIQTSNEAPRQTNKTFKETLEEQSADPHGGHIVKSKEE